MVVTRVGSALGLLALVGCGGGGHDHVVVVGPGANVAPTVEVTGPVDATAVSRGGTLAVTFTDDDPDDVAFTSLYLDGDGVFATSGDQHVIEADTLELDATTKTAAFVWDPDTTPSGTYRVLAVTSDGTNPPAVAVAPGLVTLAAVSWAKRAGGTPVGGFSDQGFGISSFADGSSVVTGQLPATATFGAGEANATSLVPEGGLDVFVARYNADGTLAWAKRAGGATSDEGRGISSFPDGSSVVSGSFQGTATFGADEANVTSLVSDGAGDIFVARYNADGTLAWAKRAGGTAGDSGGGISSFADGSSVVSGSFQGTATFGADEANVTSLVSDGADDIFVARYNADGTLAWAKRSGGGSVDSASGISSFADGSSVVTGTFDGTATFGADEANATSLVSDGGLDVFVARYDADGTLAWAKRAGGTAGDSGGGISSFADGSSVVTGQFLDTATFGAGEADPVTLVSVGNQDVFVARYDADGTLAWAKRAGGVAVDVGNRISSFADGSSVVTGVFQETATFGAGGANATPLVSDGGLDVFVARYNADGTLAWAKRAGGGSVDGAGGISSFADGSSVVTGTFFGTATFGAGEANATPLVSVGGGDIFVARYNADGGF